MIRELNGILVGRLLVCGLRVLQGVLMVREPCTPMVSNKNLT